MFIRLLVILLLFTGCSTLKRTMITSALTAGTIGGVGGAIFSPNKESVRGNTYIFSLLGAGIGALGAYLMHDKPHDQKQLKNMLLDEEKLKKQEIPLFDFSPELKNIKPNITFKPVKKYQVPLQKLPDALKGKVKKQYILEYESDARTIKIGNRTIQISPFKAWENVYEE